MAERSINQLQSGFFKGFLPLVLGSLFLTLSACQSISLPVTQNTTPVEANLQDFLLQSLREQAGRNKMKKKKKTKNAKTINIKSHPNSLGAIGRILNPTQAVSVPPNC
jgi:hypothetical protein